MRFHPINVIAAASIVLSFSTASGAQPAPIQGGVVKIQTALDDLRDARLGVTRVRKGIADLYFEVTREDVSVSSNLGDYETMFLVGMPTMTATTKPARTRWVKQAMAQIHPTVALFKEDVDIAMATDRHADVGEQAKAQLDPLRKQVFADVDASYKILEKLDALTQGTAYDNSAIAETSKTLDKRMKDLDKQLKKGMAILQKEAKSRMTIKD